ncbi:MAG: toprim domain-containing protein [Proteobacteria bacterium]|nr:toprim domain-containing protein [Pseudomonadota bacterium]
MVIVEGCFDVAKLRAAGIQNVVATFGSRLYEEQLPRIDLLSEMLGVDRFLIWYDRDQDGTEPHGTGAVEAVALLREHGFEADSFDWEQRFRSRRRGEVAIPAEITDPAEFSVEQLGWLRQEGIV